MTLSPKIPCSVCGRYDNRAVTLDALVIRDNHILLIKRAQDPDKGKWALPGGYLDHDETIEQAVIRETKEETSLTVTSLRMLGVYDDPHRHPTQNVAVSYVVSAEGIPHAGDDAAECEFFDLSSLPELLAFDHLKMITDYIRKREQMR